MNLYKKTRAILAMFKFYGYDIIRNFKHFNYIDKKSTLEKFKGELSMNYHVIEKGLTMPETRLGFGQAAQVTTLLGLLELYLSKDFPISDIEFSYSVKVLNEYLSFHKKHNFDIDKKLINRIKKLNKKCNIKDNAKQHAFNHDDYFKEKNSPFDLFALTRHSIRNYTSEEIPDQIIADCVSIAQKSPSSCNRQPIRVYAVKDEVKKTKILKLQSGNRGFGHLASTIFVITSNLSFFQNFPERNEPALNAGLFTMSFLYALHQKEIGACSLNWCVSNQRDKDLRSLLNIPNHEQVHLIISSGYLPKNIKVAASPRLEVERVLKFI